MDAVLLRPACVDLLRAGSAAVQQDHVIVLDLDAVQGVPDGGDIVEVLAAGEARPGCLRAACIRASEVSADLRQTSGDAGLNFTHGKLHILSEAPK